MKATESENMKLLMDILNLKTKKSELYQQTGPSSSDYISLSIKLDLLVNSYLEEKLVDLI
ncbi:MAG: hypothetical protein K6T88_10325 [Bacillus sp. (in: Bacteria)]|nr:hypothetical protein [Bacillus sp. (in: firmicutes)]